MCRKAFDPELYEANDRRAREAVRRHLDLDGTFTMSKETYGPDIRALVPERHEVEIKHGWKEAWPEEWKTLHIPERKARLLQDKNGADAGVIFWVLSSDCTRAWRVNSVLLAEDMIEEVPNSMGPKGEKFFCVPVHICQRVRLKGTP